MKIKLFVTYEIQYFELGIFSLNSYAYYLSRGFIASSRAFNLLTCSFHLTTRAFNLPTRTFNHATSAFSLPARGFELVTRVSLFHIFSETYNKVQFQRSLFCNDPKCKSFLTRLFFQEIKVYYQGRYTCLFDHFWI